MPTGIYIRKKGYKHTEETKIKISQILKGRKKPPFSKEHRKKMSLSHKGKCQPWMSNKNHPSWKGENATYSALHHWIKKWKGNPQQCSICGKNGKKNGRNWSIHWANIDHSYKRNFDDFIPLCGNCHTKYDFTNT